MATPESTASWHVPQTRWFLEDVVYGDPHLNVTPSTGNMHVAGTVIDTAHSGYGYNVLEIRATQITILGGQMTDEEKSSRGPL